MVTHQIGLFTVAVVVTIVTLTDRIGLGNGDIVEAFNEAPIGTFVKPSSQFRETSQKPS